MTNHSNSSLPRQTEKRSEAQKPKKEKQGEDLLAHFAHLGETQSDTQDHQAGCSCCNKNR